MPAFRRRHEHTRTYAIENTAGATAALMVSDTAALDESDCEVFGATLNVFCWHRKKDDSEREELWNTIRATQHIRSRGGGVISISLDYEDRAVHAAADTLVYAIAASGA